MKQFERQAQQPKGDIKNKSQVQSSIVRLENVTPQTNSCLKPHFQLQFNDMIWFLFAWGFLPFMFFKSVSANRMNWIWI